MRTAVPARTLQIATVLGRGEPRSLTHTTCRATAYLMLLAIAIVAVLSPGLRTLVSALLMTGWVVYARLVRGETLSLREREFVESWQAGQKVMYP